MAITSAQLITGIKRRIIMPTSQSLFTAADILAFCDDIISSYIVSMLESVNQEYFVYKTDITLVAGQTEYSIPYRALGRALRELKMRDTSGNIANMPLIDLENTQLYFNTAFTGLTCGFYFRSDKIHIVPEVPDQLTENLYMEAWYRLPPSKLIEVTAAAQVASINGADVTVTSVPSGFAAGALIDFVQGKSGNSIYDMDIAITNISGSIITFSSADDVPSELEAGDYISPAGYSPVVNFVPNECYSYLEALVAHRALTSQSDFDGADRLERDIAMQKEMLGKMLEPRIDGEPTIIVNPYSLARGNIMSQYMGWYGR